MPGKQWRGMASARRRTCRARVRSDGDPAAAGRPDTRPRGLFMSDVMSFGKGGYRFVRGVFQYSAGVAAEPGFEIERARFRRPVPVAEGFAEIQARLHALRRPVTALCACELRSPAPLSEAGFEAFNREYVGPLERWNIFRGGVNPVARTNVCPDVDPPSVPSFWAFSYTVPASARPAGSFVIAGTAEASEGGGSYREHAIRRGDQSLAGLREKARWVLGEMERRMRALGFGWTDATGTHVYTVHDVHPFLKDEIALRGAMRSGLTWHLARPPVSELDYEMDVLGIAREVVL